MSRTGPTFGILVGQGSMRSDRYLTRPQQYERVHSQGSSWASGPIVMKAVPNGLGSSRYGFSVGHRVGNAVKRNLVKRRLREALRSKNLMPGWDIVFVARASAAGSSYATLESSVSGLLARTGLLAPSDIKTANATDDRG